MPEMNRMDVKCASQLLLASREIVVLTGAGMSTESGIPDFRSKGGLWEDPTALRMMTLSFLKAEPEAFWPKYKQVFLSDALVQAQPNIGHHILASWEQRASSVHVVTQNVDGLHLGAGSRNVLEVHGNSRKAFCPRCGTTYGMDSILEAAVPRCHWETPKGSLCDTVLYPDTVLFEQPVRDFEEAVRRFQSADLILVMGTSLTVEPVASLPDVKSAAARLMIINLEPTHLDGQADVVFHHRVTDVLKTLDAEMRGGQWQV